jgi:hypothetical protein
MTEINVTSGSESTWIEWTTPSHGEDHVSPVDNFQIKFDHIPATGSLVTNTFKIFDQTGLEVENIFRDISLGNDYDDLNLLLSLHLTEALNPDYEYTFVIDGLYDAAGVSQDSPHVVTFVTEDVVLTVAAEIVESSVITATDRTLSSADISIVTEDVGTTEHTIYMNPTDGSYNVSADTPEIVVSFYPNDVTDAVATVRRRAISYNDEEWAAVSATYTFASGALTITLPEVSANVTLEAGYEYEVYVDGVSTGAHPNHVDTGEETRMYILGPLSPMFTSVASILMQMPDFESHDIAKMIYLNSAYVVAIDSALETSPTKAARDFVYFYTLYELSTVGVDASTIQLGDLTVQKRAGSTNSDRWLALAKEAEARISKIGPQFVEKGFNYKGASGRFAARDWDSTGTTKRRIGES